MQKAQGIFGYNAPLGATGFTRRTWWGKEEDGSHASGLDNVPYDGYRARLHKGETVLTRTEATEYREKGGNNSKPNVVITGNTFHVRQESDIDAIANKLAYMLAQ
ncbi:hypothetical protein ACF3MZ_15205 [Paenibacillaceae bacterium WGS1546]|uniref:hypothetical protein n=1 Tax=Cohnella sp. WGS1546 TaxID=3366810 RepID=UPI00372D3B1D